MSNERTNLHSHGKRMQFLAFVAITIAATTLLVFGGLVLCVYFKEESNLFSKGWIKSISFVFVHSLVPSIAVGAISSKHPTTLLEYIGTSIFEGIVALLFGFLAYKTHFYLRSHSVTNENLVVYLYLVLAYLVSFTIGKSISRLTLARKSGA